MKAIIVIVILVMIYLFLPHYTLYVEENSLTNQYAAAQSGFILKSRCEAAGTSAGKPYRCEGATAWGEMFNKQQQYNQEKTID